MASDSHPQPPDPLGSQKTTSQHKGYSLTKHERRHSKNVQRGPTATTQTDITNMRGALVLKS